MNKSTKALSSQPLHSRFIPLIVAVAMFMEGLDSTIVGVAIPTIAESFKINPINMKLALTSYLISLAIFVPISGWLADRFQMRRVFMSALGIFTVGSIICGISPNLTILIMARVIQGLGAAMMLPVGRLILMRTYSKADLMRAFSATIVPALLGPALGPTIGGLILMIASWHWIFLVNVPFGIIGILATWRLLPNEVVEKPTSFDWYGFMLFGGFMASLTYGLAVMGEGPDHWQLAFIWMSLALVFLMSYFWWAKKQEHPVFNWRLFRINTFWIGISSSFILRFAISPISFVLPLLLQMVWGVTPLVSGLLFIPYVIGLMTAKSLPMRNWVARFGFKPILLITLTSMFFVSLPMMWFCQPRSFVLLAPILFTQGMISSMLFTQLGPLALLDMPPKSFGQATSIVTIMQQFSGACAIAITATLLFFISRQFGENLYSPQVFFWCYLVNCLYPLLALIPCFYLQRDTNFPAT